MPHDKLAELARQADAIDWREPTILYQNPERGHHIYWLGIEEETAFRCNTYLIRDGERAIVVDPGNRAYFSKVRDRVAQILSPEQVDGLIICHQDPDVAASLPDWLALNPALTVFSSPRTQVLLPHYGISDFAFHDIEARPELVLPSGGKLAFITAPFLHSPMAFTTLDQASGFLFSGDIFAAIDADWRLIVQDFAAHRAKLDYFHLDYMACNAASAGFVRKLDTHELTAILPQHGSIIPREHVPQGLDYLRNLQCGLDLLYPDLML